MTGFKGKALVAMQATMKEAGARWTAGENAVTELSEEHKLQYLGLVRSPETKNRLERLRQFKLSQKKLKRGAIVETGAAMRTAAPAAWDWRNAQGGHDWTTPPKDQGNCGSCVSFGTTGAMEALYKILKGDYELKPNYSEGHLFFCNKRQCIPGEPNYGWDVPDALDYLRDFGVPDDACFPYKDHDQSCNTCKDWKQRATSITAWKALNSQDEMKKWIATKGPIVSGFEVYEDFYNYVKGVYSHVKGKLLGGHCVLVVGYNDADKCWICKNSWLGTKWGENGFFRIEYGQCGIDEEMYGIEGLQGIEDTSKPVELFGHTTLVEGYKLSNFTGCHALVALRDTPGKTVAVLTTDQGLQSLLETALATGNLIAFIGTKLTNPPTPRGGIWTVDVYGIDGIILYDMK
ncbi:MAG: C1 family peptidase [Methanotrichaceae archaeon]|nr:C1 family peptidase [Methanotrichaceae archaeon]